MNVFAKFDEIPSMLLQDVKETKSYGHTFFHSDGQTRKQYTLPQTQFMGGIIIHCCHIYIYIKVIIAKFDLAIK